MIFAKTWITRQRNWTIQALSVCVFCSFELPCSSKQSIHATKCGSLLDILSEYRLCQCLIYPNSIHCYARWDYTFDVICYIPYDFIICWIPDIWILVWDLLIGIIKKLSLTVTIHNAVYCSVEDVQRSEIIENIFFRAHDENFPKLWISLTRIFNFMKIHF